MPTRRQPVSPGGHAKHGSQFAIQPLLGLGAEATGLGGSSIDSESSDSGVAHVALAAAAAATNLVRCSSSLRGCPVKKKKNARLSKKKVTKVSKVTVLV